MTMPPPVIRIFAFIAVLIIGAAPARADCTNPARPAAAIIYNADNKIIQYCDGTNWIAAGFPGSGSGGCSNPTGVEGTIIYNAGNAVMQFCGGSQWVPMGIYDGPDLTSNLVGHWKLDDSTVSGATATDSSGNGNNGTLINSPTSGTGVINEARQFNGAASNASRMTSAAEVGAIDAKTFAGWFYLDTDTPNSQWHVLAADATAFDSWKYTGLVTDGNDYITLYQGRNVGGTANYQASDPSVMPRGQWVHAAGVVDKTAGYLKLYINGVLVDTNTSASIPTSTFYDPTGGVEINSCETPASCTGNEWKGRADDVRVYNRALSAADIAALYAQGNAGTPVPVGHWQFNEGAGTTVSDSSGNGTNLTTTGSPTWTTGVEGGAMTFAAGKDATDTSPAAAAYVTGSSTVMGWVKMTNIGAVGGIFQGYSSVEFSNTQALRVQVDGSLETTACGGGAYHQADALLNAGSWYHVASVWDNATGMISLYINGVLDKSEADTCSWPGSITDIYLGDSLDGTIDDVRLYNRALSASQIQAAMMENTNISTGLLARWALDEASGTTAVDSTGGYNGTLTNFPASPWTTGQIDGALTFDGSNDYVEVGDISAMEGMSAITVGGWVKTTQITEGHLIDKGNCQGNSGGGSWELAVGYPGSGNTVFAVYPVGNTAISVNCGSNFWEPASNDGAWHYIAGTWDGTTIRSFVDGIECYGTGTAASMDSTADSVQTGGQCNGNPHRLNGSGDDIRIYSRALTGPEISALMLIDLPTCTGPSGKTGEMLFNVDNTLMQYCNGTSWVSVGKEGVNCAPSFSFTDVSGQNPASVISSNIVQVTVPSACAAPAISVSGSGSPEYRICNDNTCSSVLQTWGSTAGTFTTGKWVQVRQTSSGSPLTAQATTLAIGSGSASWNVTTNDFKLVFVTSTLYNGNLGGIAGADAKCATQATAANLPGTYKAWIATGAGADPATNFTQATVPYRKMNAASTQIASNWTDLVDGTNLGSAINFDETGTQQTAVTRAWSYTGTNGVGLATAVHCTSWTNNTAGNGRRGTISSAVAGTWNDAGQTACTSTGHLYCFQQ